VPVPDLRPAATKYATAAVVCSCNRGIWQQNKHSEEQERRRDKNKKPLPKWITLEEYEKRVPGWQEIMVQWEHGRELDRTAREESAYADRKRGPLKIGEAVKQVIDKAVK
jgi:replication initiation and membrane attachment protein DnaB